MLDKIFIFNGINRLIWTWVILILFFCSIRFLQQARIKIKRTDRLILLGNMFSFLGLALMRLFFYISDYFIVGEYISHTYYGSYANLPDSYYLFIVVGYLAFFIGLLFYFVIYEYAVQKSRFFFSILNLIAVLTVLLVPMDLKIFLIYLFSLIDTIGLICVLIWFLRKSDNEIRSLFSLFLIGFLMILTGSLLDALFIRRLAIIDPMVPAILFIMGGLITISPTYISLKILKNRTFKTLMSLFAIGILIIIDIFLILNFQIYSYWVYIVVIGFVMEIIGILYVLRIPEAIDPPDYLRIFLKPRKISEQEISKAKEEMICLVCKRKLEEFIYVCPICEAIYCKKCSDFISNRENICWVCNTPFDRKKPSLSPDSQIYPIIDNEFKKLAVVTVIEDDFYAQVEQFEWEEGEKELFLQYMLTLSSQRRREVLNEMIEKTFGNSKETI